MSRSSKSVWYIHLWIPSPANATTFWDCASNKNQPKKTHYKQHNSKTVFNLFCDNNFMHIYIISYIWPHLYTKFTPATPFWFPLNGFPPSIFSLSLPWTFLLLWLLFLFTALFTASQFSLWCHIPFPFCNFFMSNWNHSYQFLSEL